ncbi:proteinaceous RNase P 2 isoform X2 [Malania oleifera]|uniref:proteinaceous RNase P 2 isoform X2 n=1 Tax=Malania oleifera TaxID=397392 RepID=UPI0025AE9D71|nr:proteinaceous RNase P 2 isoform X2 [Malania oleifera]
MENPNNAGLPKIKKKIKHQTPEGLFRFNLDFCSKKKDLAGAISLYNSASSQKIRLNSYHLNALLYLCSTSVTDASSKDLAFEYGFRIFDHMLSSKIDPNEATITAVARLAAAKGDGDFAFELIKTMGKYNILPRLRTYGPVLFCFCEKLEADKAYKVEEHMVVMRVNAEEPELAALLKVSAETGRAEKVYEYLHKLRNSVRCVGESTAEIVESWFFGRVACEAEGVNLGADQIKEAVSSNGGGWHGLGWMGKGSWVVRRSNADSGGRCCACTEQLVSVDIDREETEKFAQSVASLAMEREVNTNFREFQVWLDEHANYKAIVDGANIGLYQQNFAEGGFSISQLDAVVKELYDRNQREWPLVILHNKRLRALMDHPSKRKLLEEWVAQGVLYATPNGSNDDWYWLYAAVKLKCLLVTNDEMRDHIFELLGKSFFLKWKERHQESEKGSWHVPLATESCESSRTWLCITRRSSCKGGNGPANTETSKVSGQPLCCNHKLLEPCTAWSTAATGSGLHDAAESFQVSNGENKVAAVMTGALIVDEISLYESQYQSTKEVPQRSSQKGDLSRVKIKIKNVDLLLFV